ncbi:MAG: LytR/AlgR family response regulator transcription factor [Flavobacteriaceae bacterium]
MTCIIVDDEATARAVVAKLCKTTMGLDIVEEFSNAIDAMKYLGENTVDVMFLDIHMPTFTGIDLIKTLKDPPLIVMTTSDPQYAIEAFEYESIVDYLVKPITEERFAKTVQKIKGAMDKRSVSPSGKDEKEGGEDLYINIDRRLIKIKMNEILFVEAKGDYIDVNTETESYRVHSTLKKIKEKLPDHTFLQIHRSYIINFNKIIDIEDNSVLIKKSVIPISRSNRPELMRRLNLL